MDRNKKKNWAKQKILNKYKSKMKHQGIEKIHVYIFVVQLKMKEKKNQICFASTQVKDNGREGLSLEKVMSTKQYKNSPKSNFFFLKKIEIKNGKLKV